MTLPHRACYRGVNGHPTQRAARANQPDRRERWGTDQRSPPTRIRMGLVAPRTLTAGRVSTITHVTVRVTLGLAVLALGLALAALAGIPALIENRSIGDIAVVVGLAVAVAGLAVGLTGIPAELRASKRRQEDESRRLANKEADRANLRVKRRRIQHTKSDVLVRLTEAREELEEIRRADDRFALRDKKREIRDLELENIIIEANLDFNANEFMRNGMDVAAFDQSP